MIAIRPWAAALTMLVAGVAMSAEFEWAPKDQGPGSGPWQFDDPEKHGLSRAKLEAVAEAIRPIGGRQGIVVVRDGVIVFERYWANEYHLATPTHRNVSFSAGKSWGSAMVGRAVTEGLLKVDDLASKYHPPERSGLHPNTTIYHLLTMSSGGTLMAKPSSRRPDPLANPRPSQPGGGYVRKEKPDEGTPPGYGTTLQPGVKFYYDGEPADHLSDIVAAASGKPSLKYITEHLLEPLGVESFAYQSEGIDPNGNVRIGGSITLSVRDMARLGLLWLNMGRWDGRQLIDAEYVKQSVTPSKLNPSYGFLWWLNAAGRVKGAPQSMFHAAGAFGQFVFVLPEQNMVIATMGYDGTRNPQILQDIWNAISPAVP